MMLCLLQTFINKRLSAHRVEVDHEVTHIWEEKETYRIFHIISHTWKYLVFGMFLTIPIKDQINCLSSSY